MSEVQHSPIGASSCERWWECPGSYTPESISGDTFYTAQGTVAHGIGEYYLRNLKRVDEHWLGQVIEEAGFKIEVDDEMLDAVTVYVDYVLDIVERFNIPPENIRVESSFSLKHIDPEAYGTCDVMLYLPLDRLIVIDYKHGAGYAVEAENNKQTLYYGVGGYYELPEEDRNDIGYVETIIVQPRAPHEDGKIRRAVYTSDYLLSWEKDLRAAIRRIRDGNTTLAAGKHCRFCPLKATCPEAANEVGRLAEADFADAPGMLPVPSTLRPDDLARILGHATFIRNWCDDVIKHANDQAKAGMDIPGFKLAAGRTKRKWIDEKTAKEKLKAAIGKEALTVKVKTVKQMEDYIKRKKLSLDIRELWTKPEPGMTLVPVGDSREALPPRAISDFADLDLDTIDV